MPDAMNDPDCLHDPVGKMASVHIDGYRFGAAGLSRDCNPYDVFDVRCRTWDEGWSEGRDSLETGSG
jgi:ribosome modulation factor